MIFSAVAITFMCRKKKKKEKLRKQKKSSSHQLRKRGHLGRKVPSTEMYVFASKGQLFSCKEVVLRDRFAAWP